MNLIQKLRNYNSISELLNLNCNTAPSSEKDACVLTEQWFNKNARYIKKLESCNIDVYSNTEWCSLFNSDKSFARDKNGLFYSSNSILYPIDTFVIQTLLRSERLESTYECIDNSFVVYLSLEDVKVKVLESFDSSIKNTLEGIGINPLDVSVDFYNFLVSSPQLNTPRKVIVQRLLSLLKHTHEQPKYCRNGLNDKIQALQTYPVLPFLFHAFSHVSEQESKTHGSIINLLSCWREQPITININQLANVIYTQKSLSSYFKECGVKPWLVKKLNNLSLSKIIGTSYSLHHYLNFSLVINELNALKPDYFPKNAADWLGFFTLISWCDRIVDQSPVISPDRTRATARIRSNIMDSCKGNFNQNINDLDQTGMRDVCNDLIRNLIKPYFAAADRAAMDAMDLSIIGYSIILENLNPTQIIERSKWWHEHQPIIVQRMRVRFPWLEAVNLEWEPITEDFIASNGYLVKSLISSESLAMESISLSHCVSGYDYSCAYENKHILGIQNNLGKRTSTVNIDISRLKISSEKDAPHNYLSCVIEHRGENNKSPIEDCNQALNEWIMAVKDKRLKVDYEAIEIGHNLRIKQGIKKYRFHNSALLSTYNYKIEGALEAAWHEYLPLFSKRLKQTGPTMFREECIRILQCEI